jgi:hypothetical protein
MAINNPYDTDSGLGLLGILGARQGLSGQDMLTSMLNGSQGVSNLGFSAQTNKYDPNGYAQLYSNWVNQRLAPYMQQYGQQAPAPTQMQQLQAQIAALQRQMAPSYGFDSGSGGN